jgi:hypothetical protein
MGFSGSALSAAGIERMQAESCSPILEMALAESRPPSPILKYLHYYSSLPIRPRKP